MILPLVNDHRWQHGEVASAELLRASARHFRTGVISTITRSQPLQGIEKLWAGAVLVAHHRRRLPQLVRGAHLCARSRSDQLLVSLIFLRLPFERQQRWIELVADLTQSATAAAERRLRAYRHNHRVCELGYPRSPQSKLRREEFRLGD